MLGELGGPAGALHRRIAGAPHAVCGGPGRLRLELPAEEVEPADDQGQQVVEVVRDAAGQLAHRLHLLRLPERLLGAQALVDGGGDPLLELGVDALQLLRRPPREVARGEQLLLVFPSVAGVEDGGEVDRRLALRVEPLSGVDQGRQAVAVLADEIERHLADRALHAQQRGEVRLVVDPPGEGEPVLEPGAAQFLGGVAGPAKEGPVDPDDGAVRKRRQIAAGRVLVQRLVVEAERRRTGTRRRGGPVYRAPIHALIASTVSSGALRFGQCPVARILTSRLAGRRAWT